MYLHIDFSVNSCIQLPHRCGTYVHLQPSSFPASVLPIKVYASPASSRASPAHLPPQLGHILGVSSQLPAPLAPPPSQAAHLTIWLLFFQSRCKGLHQRPGTSLISLPHFCFYGWASIVHIVCVETRRREGVM